MTAPIAFTAPHFAAAEIGHRFLEQGANAVDAMVAASAAISVAYPHMNSLAGDGFWLIQKKGQSPVAIDACGQSAKAANIDWYLNKGLKEIPSRGGSAALCMGGTLDGWRVARDYMQGSNSGETSANRSLDELLAPAIQLAKEGIEVTHSLQLASEKVREEFAQFGDYQKIFCPERRSLKQGDQLRNPGLAHLLETLAAKGTEDFYSGSVSKKLTDWLELHGSPLSLADFQGYSAKIVEPLSVDIRGVTLYNLPAPTQGIASLLILAIYDRLVQAHQSPLSEVDHTHYLIEATKAAFLIRDAEVRDPSKLSQHWPKLLKQESIDALAASISPEQAMPWPKEAEAGDTVWMGATDSDGTLVSFIQSIYWEFGSGLVNPEYGLIWNNRGLSFSLNRDDPKSLEPGLKPFHTLNPAMAIFDDGRRLSYGTMGGEGQPQTQAAIFSRFQYQGLSLQEAIGQDRWLLGRTWGDQSQDLKVEESLCDQLGHKLVARGHRLTKVPSHSEIMGHAGAICLRPDQSCEAATDPRSDGRALVGEKRL